MVLQAHIVFYCSLLTANHLLQQCLLMAALSWPGLSVFINENISGNCHLVLQTRQHWQGTSAALIQEGGPSQTLLSPISAEICHQISSMTRQGGWLGPQRAHRKGR